MEKDYERVVTHFFKKLAGVSSSPGLQSCFSDIFAAFAFSGANIIISSAVYEKAAGSKMDMAKFSFVNTL